MKKTINLEMYESATEIQNYFKDIDNRLDQGFAMRYYQYKGKGSNWEVPAQYGLLYDHSADYMTTLTKVVMLPEPKHLMDFVPHVNLIDLDGKFEDFKKMLYEDPWSDNGSKNLLGGRGEDPLDFFKTYDELWLGFVMMDRYWKRWDGKKWVHTDIFPDYFKMDKETARQNGYPDPDGLQCISGLRGYIKQ